jgi:hypothetical protein
MQSQALLASGIANLDAIEERHQELLELLASQSTSRGSDTVSGVGVSIAVFPFGADRQTGTQFISYEQQVGEDSFPQCMLADWKI